MPSKDNALRQGKHGRGTLQKIYIVAVCRQESESSDDEEHFQRKEEKRLERDKAKLNPVILSERRPCHLPREHF